MSQLRSGTTEVVAPDGQVSDDFFAYSCIVVIQCLVLPTQKMTIYTLSIYKRKHAFPYTDGPVFPAGEQRV